MPEIRSQDTRLVTAIEVFQDLQKADFAYIAKEIIEKDLFGKNSSFDIDKISWFTAGINSSKYALEKMQSARRFKDQQDLMKFALSLSPKDGLLMEFGVFSGKTINYIANIRYNSKIYGFDSFEGLPEDWRPGFLKGSFHRTTLPDVLSNVELVSGLFDKTLPLFCKTHFGEKISFIHVDCDIYSSTKTLFFHLKDFIVPGTVILFDEYFNYPGWEQHEVRAFREFCTSHSVQYEYVGLVAHHQQVAVRIV